MYRVYVMFVCKIIIIHFIQKHLSRFTRSLHNKIQNTIKETRNKLLVQDRRLRLVYFLNRESSEFGIEVGYKAPVSNIRQKIVPVSGDMKDEDLKERDGVVVLIQIGRDNQIKLNVMCNMYVVCLKPNLGTSKKRENFRLSNNESGFPAFIIYSLQ